jgi:hypothetical protein
MVAKRAAPHVAEAVSCSHPSEPRMMNVSQPSIGRCRLLIGLLLSLLPHLASAGRAAAALRSQDSLLGPSTTWEDPATWEEAAERCAGQGAALAPLALATRAAADGLLGAEQARTWDSYRQCAIAVWIADEGDGNGGRWTPTPNRKPTQWQPDGGCPVLLFNSTSTQSRVTVAIDECGQRHRFMCSAKLSPGLQQQQAGISSTVQWTHARRLANADSTNCNMTGWQSAAGRQQLCEHADIMQSYTTHLCHRRTGGAPGRRFGAGLGWLGRQDGLPLRWRLARSFLHLKRPNRGRQRSVSLLTLVVGTNC